MEAKLTSFEEFPSLMGVKDLERIFPLSRAGIYNLIKTSGFPVLTVGTRKLIPKDSLIDWIHQNTAMQYKSQGEAK